MLTRDAILAADDLKRVEVPVPEWSGSVFVRAMTGGERDAFEVAYQGAKSTDIRARLVVATACDEAGNLLFTEQDVPLLTRKNAGALQRIFNVAIDLSKISNKDVEELEKNSDASPSDGSASSSP